jgi:hypothetical protein
MTDDRDRGPASPDQEPTASPADESRSTADADTADAATGEAAADSATDSPADAESTSAVSESQSNDGSTGQGEVPEDVRKYDRFQKIDGGTYDRANDFLRERTYITAREWAIARLCADFRTETGVEMTKIGENLPELDRQSTRLNSSHVF